MKKSKIREVYDYKVLYDNLNSSIDSSNTISRVSSKPILCQSSIISPENPTLLDTSIQNSQNSQFRQPTVRILPKTRKNFMRGKFGKKTQPKPFNLSKSNFPKADQRNTQERKFKARKMPDMKTPYLVYRDLHLTDFHDFNLCGNPIDGNKKAKGVHKPRQAFK